MNTWNGPRALAAGVACLAAAGLAACADPGGSGAGPSRAAVVFGEPDFDEEGTVYLESGAGACSGSVIAPTVILTANHCVEGTVARDWDVYTGQSPTRLGAVAVDEIVRPGPFTETSVDDLALLVLNAELRVPRYVQAGVLAPTGEGSEVKIVGYGLDENDRSGRRLSATMEIAYVDRYMLELWGSSYPGSGDSGGPVIDDRGEVVGVISRGGPGVCIATRVDTFRWLLDPVLREQGGCVAGDPETCDGFDNNCDRVIDEGCTAPGEPCETAEECPTGRCEEVDGVAICTSPCDPTDREPCWAGAFCKEIEGACGEGWCRLGSAGEGDAGELCDDDVDCASLMCRDPGDGQHRCTTRCALDAFECPSGQGCAEVGQGCGGCFPLEGSTWPRGLGEDCTDDAGCRSESCVSEPDGRYCSRPCGAGVDPCPELMHCRAGRCVRGDLAELGQRCLSDDDCADGPCWLEGPSGPVCTEACGPTHTQCSRRASCDYDLELCVPWDSPLGGPCEPGGETLCAEGECTEVEGEEPRCAWPCAEGCPAGFECREDGVEEPLCWPAPPAPEAEGCGCVAAGASGPVPSLFRRIVTTTFTRLR